MCCHGVPIQRSRDVTNGCEQRNSVYIQPPSPRKRGHSQSSSMLSLRANFPRRIIRPQYAVVNCASKIHPTRHSGNYWPHFPQSTVETRNVFCQASPQCAVLEISPLDGRSGRRLCTCTIVLSRITSQVNLNFDELLLRKQWSAVLCCVLVESEFPILCCVRVFIILHYISIFHRSFPIILHYISIIHFVKNHSFIQFMIGSGTFWKDELIWRSLQVRTNIHCLSSPEQSLSSTISSYQVTTQLLSPKNRSLEVNS